MNTSKIFSASLLIFNLALPGLASAALPDPGMTITKGLTALVITDPQKRLPEPQRCDLGCGW